MGWEVGGRFKREEIYVYIWLIHIVVWQKSIQYCKKIILQLNKKTRVVGILVIFLQIIQITVHVSSRRADIQLQCVLGIMSNFRIFLKVCNFIKCINI